MTDQTSAGTAESPRYALEGRIATGGMGEVWKATDTVLDREVAVKILKPEYADDATFRSRFEAEARHAAALHHPNVAAVFDFGELPADDGSDVPRPYLVMELVPGQPLSALLRDGEPMPAETAADLVAQAADAMAVAHALDIVHRDIKPANLLVTPSGTVKVTDFGIARAADGAALTATGQIVGTPQYLSPEQAEGKQATRASDIYALGVVLYECLAGRRPFQGDTPVATALAHLRDEPQPLPETVPAHLRAVTAAALTKDPAARIGSAEQLAAALRGAPLPAGLAAAAPAAPTVTEAPAVATGGIPGAGAAEAAAAVAATHDLEGADGTRVMTAPPAAAGATTHSRARRRALPPWLPWAGAAAAVLLIVGAFALAGGDGGPGSAASADATDAASSAAPSPESSPTVPVIRAGRYVGRPHDVARKQLEALGYEVREQKAANPGDHAAGTVAAVSPTGPVQPGSEVTLSVWDKAPAPAPAPKHGKDHGPGKGHEHGPKGEKKKP